MIEAGAIGGLEEGAVPCQPLHGERPVEGDWGVVNWVLGGYLGECRGLICIPSAAAACAEATVAAAAALAALAAASAGLSAGGCAGG